MSHFGAFLGLAALVIVTPGPDTALTIRNALLGGRRGGAATALGVATGQAVWTLAASAGVAALLAASGSALAVIRIAGAAYLVLLGARSLWAALRRRAARRERAAAPATPRLSPAAAFKQGLLSNLGNPKMAVFFTSLLPQFAQGGRGAFAPLLLLGLVFCALTLVWLIACGAAVARAGDMLLRSTVRRVLDAITGAVLVALGLGLAAEQR